MCAGGGLREFHLRSKRREERTNVPLQVIGYCWTKSGRKGVLAGQTAAYALAYHMIARLCTVDLDVPSAAALALSGQTFQRMPSSTADVWKETGSSRGHPIGVS
jgi:hypothetical protein